MPYSSLENIFVAANGAIAMIMMLMMMVRRVQETSLARWCAQVVNDIR